jgi:AcrR family transcriptional regulator
MGFSKPALYYYITGKEDLLRSIIGMMMKRAKKVAAVGKLTLPPREKLAKIIRMIVEYAAEDQEIALIAFEQSKILPKRSRDALKRHQKEIEHVVQQTLREGVKQGCFAIDDIRMTSFAILAVSNWVYRWYNSSSSLSPAQIADRFIELLEHGYLKDKGS